MRVSLSTILKNTFIIIFSVLLSSCSGNKQKKSINEYNEPISDAAIESVWYDGEMPIIFNVDDKYPETDIRLSDLADIEYIKIGMNENFLIRGLMSCNGNDFFVADDKVYMMDVEKYIYIFNPDGTPVKVIDRQGGGPEEYRYISYYFVDTLNKEIFVQSGSLKKSIVYDLDGNFKRSFSNLAKEIGNLNDSLIINYFQYNPGGPRYSVTRKEDGSTVKACPIRFNVQLPHDSAGRLAYGSLIPSPSGYFLSNLGNDTIFEITKTLDIRHRIVDKSDYGTTFAQAHPTIETNRHLLFYILRSHNYKPLVKQNFYIYDKKENQIYKIRDYEGNDFWSIMQDYPHITNWEVTQNVGVGIRLRLASALIGHEEYCQEELRQIVENELTDESNPVLIVMKFKDSSVR